MTDFKQNKSIVTILFALGLAGLIGLGVWYAVNPEKIWNWLTYQGSWVVPSQPIPTPAETQTQLPPTNIAFPSLNKDLVVSAGVIRDGKWDLYDDKAAWLATSAVPGQGNVIIYAHNRNHLFGNLNRLRIGDLIEVTQADKVHLYQVRELREVHPTDVESILSPQDQLTLYTCEGSFDQKRLVVYADRLS